MFWHVLGTLWGRFGDACNLREGVLFDMIRHRLVVRTRYCQVLGFSIGKEFQKEFQKEFLFDNKLVGLHWSSILV